MAGSSDARLDHSTADTNPNEWLASRTRKRVSFASAVTMDWPPLLDCNKEAETRPLLGPWFETGRGAKLVEVDHEIKAGHTYPAGRASTPPESSMWAAASRNLINFPNKLQTH
jgi:hypothetical protein